MNLFSYDDSNFDENIETDEDELLGTKDHSVTAQAELILMKFDFDRVIKVFEIFDLKYSKKNEKDIIEEFFPDEEYLANFALSLLMLAAEKGKEEKQEYIISSGGFEASYYPDDETLSLKWILEQKETFCDEPNELVYVI
jgi:hypothetical protein